MADFEKQRKSYKVLEEVTNFLAKKLDDAFGLNGSTLNRSVHMGLHVAGYNSLPEETAPGICHVFIEHGSSRFDPQKTMLSLPPHAPGYHLRNGMYEEFAMMWPALSGIDTSFRSLIASLYRDMLTTPKDPIALQAEWFGSWVKQMCLMIKTVGLPEYIENNLLMGKGMGYIDVHLLTSAVLTGVPIWTLDKRLAQVADTFHAKY
jgi:hypothetical protein